MVFLNEVAEVCHCLVLVIYGDMEEPADYCDFADAYDPAQFVVDKVTLAGVGIICYVSGYIEHDVPKPDISVDPVKYVIIPRDRMGRPRRRIKPAEGKRILAYRSQGWSIDRIAEKMKIRNRTIAEYIKAHNDPVDN